MKIIVTGEHGFIGSHMATFLKEKGHDVRFIAPQGRDLRNYDGLADQFRGVDMVYHFAANMGGVGFFSEHNYQPFVDNILIDTNVFKACHEAGVGRVFYASSACIYPINILKEEFSTIRLSEQMILPANSDQMYGWEKLMMTLLAKHAPVDIRVGILNTVFGEGQAWIGDRVKFPPAITYKVLRAKKAGTPITIWGNGNQTRTFLYIEDAVEKIYEIMTSPDYFGEVNIASDEVVTIKECADWLCEIAGITPNYEFDTTKPSGVLSRGIDNRKFEKHYSYRSKTTTRKGFEKLYHWMEQQV